jgi:hypothetical protein
MAGGGRSTLYLGSAPSYGATHFRLEGQNETYLTNEITSWEAYTSISSWIDTLYVDVSREDVIKLTLENAEGRLVFLKDTTGSLTMSDLGEDEILAEQVLASFLGRATSVTMFRPLGKSPLPEYGLDRPGAVVTLQTGEKTMVVSVGTKDPLDNRFIVKSSESDYYVKVSEYSVSDFVEKSRGDFLEQPATPTPEQSAPGT